MNEPKPLLKEDDDCLMIGDIDPEFEKRQSKSYTAFENAKGGFSRTISEEQKANKKMLIQQAEEHQRDRELNPGKYC